MKDTQQIQHYHSPLKNNCLLLMLFKLPGAPNPAACAANRTVLLQGCSSGNSTAGHCVGSASFNDQQFVSSQCSSAAYQGHLCGKCAVGHGSIRPFECRQCMNKQASIALYVFGAAFMLGFIKLLCHFTLKESHQHSAVMLLVSREDGVQPTHLLRHLVLHAQYMLIIASVQAGATWPAIGCRAGQGTGDILGPSLPRDSGP